MPAPDLSQDPSPSDVDTPLAVIRQAATRMRAFADQSPAISQTDAQRAVADWLDAAGADLWAHGPLCCEDGCMECDDDPRAPHLRHALRVARLYLEGTRGGTGGTMAATR